MKEMAAEFLKREPSNVFIVQWDGEVNYFQATQDIRVVALEIAALIKHLVVKCGLRGSDVHLVGHSLGAHTCGYVGQHVPGVGRITGLDPADPSYTYMPEFVRLDPSDADFVDVIHTDSQSILGNGLGMRQPVGHLDFFPNAGRYQPGCELWKVPEAALRKGVRGVVSAAADFTVCSHSRAPRLFTESINSHCRFLAFRCASYMALHLGQCISCGNNMERCAVMGMDADKFMPAEGFSRNSSFFLTTANEPPFCQHPYAVRIFPADIHNTSHWGHLSVELRGISGLVKELPLTENDDLTGPLPLVGIRLPNPLRRVAVATAAATTGPREVPPRQPLLLVAWARNFTGQRVLSAALRWESVDRSPLRRLIPCFFRCADPLSVARIVVRTFPHPLREVDNELCPEGGQDVVEIDSRSSATLAVGCEGRQQQRPLLGNQ
ncbi:pancreatic triacylglycerol lipase-like [Schistocerca nitens]|uniref:pancreatic triacylglycerol lipase-like n=1 Tax=Schistocerca nitens TaxID=7011 RepID=UPI00211888AE|nr:pancreatic triacylglycerol lipase-like [Schistocerca nitens]